MREVDIGEKVMVKVARIDKVSELPVSYEIEALVVEISPTWIGVQTLEDCVLCSGTVMDKNTKLTLERNTKLPTWRREMMEAQAYVDERGKAVEDWLTAFIEPQFGRVVEGLPTNRSQFGIEYQQLSVFLDSRDDHAAMMHSLTTMVHQMLPPSDERLGMTLVWRIRPLVSAAPNPPEQLIAQGSPEGHNPFRVKVRFRYHTMPGTDAKDPTTEPDPRSSAGHGDG